MRNLLLVLLLALFLSNCGESNSQIRDDPHNQGVEVKIDNSKSLKELKDERDKLKAELTTLNTVIQEKEIEQVRFWSKLIGFIGSGLGIIALIASFFLMSYAFLPTILRYCGYILIAIGFISFLGQYLYIYALPIGLVTLFVILTSGVYFWYHDRRTLTKVVSVVDDTKTLIPDYKNKFRKVIDKKADNVINKIRGIK